jgi:predicted CoA-binding protein
MTDTSVSRVEGVLIRDGLRTNMTYAVVASVNDWGRPERAHGQDTFFFGMLKPPYEAFKIAEVMRRWGATVYEVDPDDTTGARFTSLTQLPAPVDCAVLSISPRQVPATIEDMRAARVPVAWIQYSLMKAGSAALIEGAGIRAVVGCVLLHWDLDHVSGVDKGRNVCHIHTVLSRAWRVQVNPDDTLTRLPPQDIRTLPWTRETFGAKLISPNYPDVEVLKEP